MTTNNPLLPERLQRSVRFLCRSHPKWGTPAGAFGECLIASHELKNHLSVLGEHAEIVQIPVHQLRQCDPLWEPFRGKEHLLDDHYAVRYGPIIIDLTARQFDSTAPFPSITHSQKTFP